MALQDRVERLSTYCSYMHSDALPAVLVLFEALESRCVPRTSPRYRLIDLRRVALVKVKREACSDQEVWLCLEQCDHIHGYQTFIHD
jgi:hypothetical protein